MTKWDKRNLNALQGKAKLSSAARRKNFQSLPRISMTRKFNEGWHGWLSHSSLSFQVDEKLSKLHPVIQPFFFLLQEKKIEREKLLQELWEFEQNEKVEEKIREQLEYRFRVRVETRLALEEQLMDQHRRREIEALEDRLFREKQLELLAERDKLDQLSDEKRRRKMAEHRKAIQELLEERKTQRVENLAKEMQQRDMEQEREKRK